MKKNMSVADRVVRTILAAIASVLIFTGTITGFWQAALVILVIIFLITGAIGFCPLYAVLGISTKKKDLK